MKIEIKNRKKTTSKREEREKKFKSGKEAIESKKSRKDTQKNAQFFADFRLARLARGVEQRQKQKTSIRIPPLRTPEKQKRDYQVADKKLEKIKRSKKKQKQI